jgi:hypothetical protein
MFKFGSDEILQGREGGGLRSTGLLMFFEGAYNSF